MRNDLSRSGHRQLSKCTTPGFLVVNRSGAGLLRVVFLSAEVLPVCIGFAGLKQN